MQQTTNITSSFCNKQQTSHLVFATNNKHHISSLHGSVMYKQILPRARARVCMCVCARVRTCVRVPIRYGRTEQDRISLGRMESKNCFQNCVREPTRPATSLTKPGLPTHPAAHSHGPAVFSHGLTYIYIYTFTYIHTSPGFSSNLAMGRGDPNVHIVLHAPAQHTTVTRLRPV